MSTAAHGSGRPRGRGQNGGNGGGAGRRMRAAITGWALRTPLGVTPDEVCERLLAGQRAARPNPHFPAATYPCQLAATIPGAPRPSPHGRVLRRMGLFAIEAAHEALAGATVARGDRLGVFSAMGGLRVHWDEIMPALAGQEDDFRDAWARGLKGLHPFWMLRHLSNNAHALVAQDLQARGEGVTFAGANAGAQALAAAIRALAAGVVDAALVLAHDSLVEPETIIELAARGALATCALPDLGAPYDQNAGGAVPGEAAAAVLLESASLPDDRPGDRSRTLAWIEAADGCDGGDGDGDPLLPAAATLARVVAQIAGDDADGRDADCQISDGQIIDGCALARPALDRAERHALAHVVGPDARLTAVQAATGCLGAATSLVQAIVLASLLRAGTLPPIAGLQQPAPGPLLPVAVRTSTRARCALGVSVGAPGLVAAIRVSLPPAATLRTRHDTSSGEEA